MQRDVWRAALAGGLALVAEDSALGRPRGFVTWTLGAREPFCPPYGADWPAPFVWIDVLFVDHRQEERKKRGFQVFFKKKTSNSFRRGGLARLLYKEVGREARKRKDGLQEMLLDVYHQNRNSIAFHTAIGFRHIATVFRRKVGARAVAGAAGGVSFRAFSGSAEDRELLLEACAARASSKRGAAQLAEQWAANCLIAVDEKTAAAVGICHWSVSDMHPFGVSYGKYDYQYVFLDLIFSRQRGVGEAVQQVR